MTMILPNGTSSPSNQLNGNDLGNTTLLFSCLQLMIESLSRAVIGV